MNGWVKKNPKKAGWLAAGIITTIVILDQILKFYIKLNFALGESFEIFPWFQIHFIENNGMAFGMEWGQANIAKYCLTFFRIFASAALCYYLYKIIKRGAHTFYLVLISMITAGAMGNIFDCVFYGLIFTDSPVYYANGMIDGPLATLVPFTGNGHLFLGEVVDMFYFPLITNDAGEVVFFNAIFNIADSAITVSVFLLLIIMFFRKDIMESAAKKPAETEQNEPSK